MYLSLGAIMMIGAFLFWRFGRASLLALLVAFTAGALLSGTLAGRIATGTAQTGATVVQQGVNAGTGGAAGRR
jgi:hypothetical protein